MKPALLYVIIIALVLTITMTMTATAYAQPTITSPIQPGISPDVVQGDNTNNIGPQTFTDLENSQHATGFSIYVPTGWFIDHFPTEASGRIKNTIPPSLGIQFEEAVTLCEERLSFSPSVSPSGQTYHCGAFGGIAIDQISVRMLDTLGQDPLEHHMAILANDPIHTGNKRIENITDTTIDIVDSTTNHTIQTVPAKMADIVITQINPSTGNQLNYLNTVPIHNSCD
jgi:hypothetical protein